MPDIEVRVRNKIAMALGQTVYVCGNSDYTITFDFDAEWAAHTFKTARFRYGNSYTDILFEGTSVSIPVIENASHVEVGVFAGDLHTTTPAYITARASIRSGSGAPHDPSPSIYEQIIDLLEHISGANPATRDRLGVIIVGDNLEITADGLLSAVVPLNLSDLDDDATHRLVTDLEKAGWNAKYILPQSGIPASDMAQSVQEALSAAQSAVQPSVLNNYATKQYVDDAIADIDMPSALSDLTDDAQHRTVTDSQIDTWNGKATSASVTAVSNRVSAIESKEAGWDAKQDALTPGTDYATPAQVQQEVSDATSDMATQTWVDGQNYITEDDIPVVSVNGKTGVVVLTASDLGIGSVFLLKGSKPTASDLPSTGNTKGDVWYVVDESVGYIWLNDGTVDRWEMLGLSVDLSQYVTTSALASALTGYVAKVSGKDLSTNDFTDAYKTKLDAAITSLAGYATESWVTTQGYQTAAQVSAAVASGVSGKQDTISDLATIRSNAANGQTAYTMLSGVEALLAAI